MSNASDLTTTLIQDTTTQQPTPIEREGQPAPATAWQGMTVGGALAGLIVLVAAGVRLILLGNRPLGENEAAGAWMALRFVQDQPTDLTPFSPLLAHLHLFLFSIFTASDFWARFIPALAGTLLVALPFTLFRASLGSRGTLAASFFLAFSPTFILFSRSATPTTLSAVTLLVFAGAIFDYMARQQRHSLFIAAAALALGLTAGPLVYTGLFFLLLFGLLVWATGRNRDTSAWQSSFARAFEALQRDREGVLRAGGIFATTLAISATGFLLHFSGIQGVLNQFVHWLQWFSLGPNGPIWYYAEIMALYEPAIFLMGILGIAVAIRQRDLFSLFLVTWAIGSLLLYTLLGVRQPAVVPAILLPFILLAGKGVTLLFKFPSAEDTRNAWLIVAFAMPLLGYALLQLTFYTENATQTTSLLLALGAAGMALILGLIFAANPYGMAWPPATVLRGAGISLLLFSLGLTSHMTWTLNFMVHEPARELLLANPTSSDIRNMVHVLQTVSQDRTGDTISLPIAVDSRLAPVVPWVLRDFTHVTIVDQVRQPGDALAVLVPSTENLPAIGDRYVGQRFRLQTQWQPVGLTGYDFVRWYLYRKGPAVQTQDLILFVSQ